MKNEIDHHQSEPEDKGLVFGRNAVAELLKSGRTVDKIYIQSGKRDGSAVKIVAEARSSSIPVVEASKKKLDEMACGVIHQGIAAAASAVDYVDIDHILEIAKEKGEKPFIVICDSINDPHNLGAIIRTADAAGVHGIIIPKRGGSGITPTVVKASAGAVAHIAFAKVSNIVAAIEELKKKGIWIYALEAGGKAYYKEKFDSPSAFVLGSEGEGVSRLIKERSDFIISIPMYGKVTSLNVSAATAVVLMEAAKQKNETE
ncbi:MAG: 23S rRNA (guanosine(2251)-2'-O)-methyltransferase RlmB [Eubacteriales bacterium]|nr:23S rRNA (guanosine(2251)-2'-O)-methyltransferase RlmB [Eubacteriales bacterium]MDD4474635.1 23S rRNA (guanosine(2251)-2'-O)-methyltransferase RlmB [Eubacteriales bacterium]